MTKAKGHTQGDNAVSEVSGTLKGTSGAVGSPTVTVERDEHYKGSGNRWLINIDGSTAQMTGGHKGQADAERIAEAFRGEISKNGLKGWELGREIDGLYSGAGFEYYCQSNNSFVIRAMYHGSFSGKALPDIYKAKQYLKENNLNYEIVEYGYCG